MKLIVIILLILILNVILNNGQQQSNEIIIRGSEESEFCPFPLKFRARSGTDNQDFLKGYVYAKNDSQCLLPCPSPIYSKNEINVMAVMIKTTGTISFITSLILLLIYSPLINRMGLNRHSIGIFFLTFGIFLIMLTDIIYVDRGNDLICPESHKYSRQSDPGCSITGILFQFGCLLSVACWFTLALDLFLTLKKISTKRVEKWYLLILSSVALILTLVPLAKRSYGYHVTGLACWILDPYESIYFFWGPFTIVLGLGSIFIILIVIEIYKISKLTKQKNGIFFQLYIRPLLIVLLIFGQFIFILAFNSLINDKFEEYSTRMDNYIDCLYKNGGSGSNSALNTTICTLKTFPFSMEFIVLLFLRLIGIEVLVFYGFSQSTKIILLHSFLLNNRFVKKHFPTLTECASLDFSTVDEELKVVNFGVAQSSQSQSSVLPNNSNTPLPSLSSQQLNDNSNNNVNAFMVSSFDNNSSLVNQMSNSHLAEKNNIILNNTSNNNNNNIEDDNSSNNSNDNNIDIEKII